jgi:hypothetical protein
MKHEKVKADNPKAYIISFLLMWAFQARIWTLESNMLHNDLH